MTARSDGPEFLVLHRARALRRAGFPPERIAVMVNRDMVWMLTHGLTKPRRQRQAAPAAGAPAATAGRLRPPRHIRALAFTPEWWVENRDAYPLALMEHLKEIGRR